MIFHMNFVQNCFECLVLKVSKKACHYYYFIYLFFLWSLTALQACEAMYSFPWGYPGSKDKNRANFKNLRYFQITKADLCGPVLCPDKT